MLAYLKLNLPYLLESSSLDNTIFTFLYFLFMSAVILGAAYLATKYIAKRGIPGKGNRNLKVIETLSLGLDKSIFLIKAGEKYFLMGNSQKSITLLAEIERDKLNLMKTGDSNSPVNGVGFDEIKGENVENYMSKLAADESESGPYSIKDNLLRLKSMVRGSRVNEKN